MHNRDIAYLRSSHSDTLERMANGIKLSRIARSALQSILADRSVASSGLVIEATLFNLEAALRELETAEISLVVADICLDDHMAKFNQCAAEEAAEVTVFAEAVSSTTH